MYDSQKRSSGVAEFELTWEVPTGRRRQYLLKWWVVDKDGPKEDIFEWSHTTERWGRKREPDSGVYITRDLRRYGEAEVFNTRRDGIRRIESLKALALIKMLPGVDDVRNI